MKKIIAALLALTLMASAAGCGTKSDSDESAASGEKTKITMVLDWVPNTNHTGLYVAEKLGYFAEEGLEVTVQQPPEDGADSLVASGGAQFGISFQETLANSMTSDSPLPVTAVAAILQHNTSGIISLKSKGIASPKDMSGHNYATWDTPIEKAILKDVITKDGGDYGKVEMIPSTVTDVVAALNTNIDTVWVYYAWDGVTTRLKGLDTNFFYFKDLNPALDFYTPLMIANDRFLADHPAEAKAFLKAVRRGYEYCVDHPEEAADILCGAVPEIDREIAVESQKYLTGQYKAEVDRWGEFDKSRWDTFYAWLYDNGVISKQIPSGQGFTNDYLN